MSARMTERTTVRLPDELLGRARRKAAAEGRTLTSLIEEGLRRVLDDAARRQAATRVMPRVSKAKGGLMPGLSREHLSSLVQELEDLDYAERLKRSFE